MNDKQFRTRLWALLWIGVGVLIFLLLKWALPANAQNRWTTYNYDTNSYSMGTVVPLGNDNYRLRSYDYNTNSYTTGTITPLGEEQYRILEYDYNTNSYSTTTTSIPMLRKED